MYKEGDVSKVLLRLGIDAEERNNELVGFCPMHLERTGREDHNPSWSINMDSGVHHCFSCGYKGTLFTLVAEINEFLTEWGRFDFEAVKAWLRQNIEIDFDALAKQLEDLRDAYVSVPRPVEMSEARLAVFDSPPEWALQARGLTAEGCERYGIKWDKRTNAWITPIRTPETNALLGWQEKGQQTRLFRNRPTGIKKSSTLFGLDQWDGSLMIVVESPLDVPLLPFKHGVATFGASISDAQVDLMRAADKLIIAFDNPRIDAAGAKASKDMLERSKKEGFECFFFNYGESDAKDIGDMSADEISYGLKNAKHCVFGERAIYGH